ncbi:MAG TPA: DUF6600 domain-containing protein [Xanthobacteraceae bacterium]
MTAMTKRLARAVLIAGLALPVTTLLPANAPFAISKAHAEATTMAEFKSILANYGKWGTHEKYGAIWVPTVTPPGWHPYPACQWAYTKDGWYFNDDTAWGSIVHHYGRWSHDEQIGWFWVPDEDWSPGWVVWRKSDKWIGWAPMPPEQDYQLVSSDAFNNDKLWIFMEARKFLNGECGNSVSASQAYYETGWTSLFNLPGGLLVDIIYVPHWKIKVITKLITIIIDRVCPPDDDNTPPPRRDIRVKSPIHFDPPPPPKGRTANDTPPISVRVFNDPGLTIDLPSQPGRGGKVRRGGDNSGRGGDSGGGRISRVDGGGSNWKRPHVSILNSYGHGLNLGTTGPVRSPSLAIGPRVNAVGMGGRNGFSAIR